MGEKEKPVNVASVIDVLAGSSEEWRAAERRARAKEAAADRRFRDEMKKFQDRRSQARLMDDGEEKIS